MAIDLWYLASMGNESRTPIRFVFNDQKATQAAAYLLSLSEGKMSYLRLIKLLYLADRKMLIEHGSTITGDSMVSMDHGPVLSLTYDLIRRKRPSSWWEQFIGPPDEEKEVSLIRKPNADALSAYELSLLDGVYAEKKPFSKWEVRDQTHELPEWENPNGSPLPIRPDTILRVEGVSESDISRIQSVTDDILFFNSI
jgi:uncharacterized phage-associated protein